VLVYFDTNVYDHIARSGAAAQVRAMLNHLGWSVIASADNLFEIYAIIDVDLRALEIRALTAVARRFDNVPHSYREAMEVRAAISKYRPTWIRRIVFESFSRRQRGAHLRHWKAAKRGVLPDPRAYAVYSPVFEAGAASRLAFQRELRQRKVKREEAVLVKVFGNMLGAVRTDLVGEVEAFWRSECWLAYDCALVDRYPAMRDLYDWLAPHLKMERVTTDELLLLWCRDVRPLDVPRSMWSGLIAWGQLHSKASHGNANDQQHAAMALETDLFVTADRGFYKALMSAGQHYPGRVAHSILWPRAASVTEALETVVQASKHIAA